MAGKRGSRGRGKKATTVPCPSPPPSTPEVVDEQPPSPPTSQASSPSTSHSPTQQSKKAKTVADLTVAQEDDMASWLEDNELLYNKKLNAYKDFRKKDALWDAKAESMDKPVDVLKTWYRSIRTRYTRLVHRRSGDGASDLTERDDWILRKFLWLKVHVIEVKKKTTVSIKEKIAHAASLEDVDEDRSDATNETETEPETNSRQRLEPLSRRSSGSSTKNASQEEERLLSNIATRGDQSLAFQNKVLEILAPTKATERTAYADWTKEVMVSLHPSLWLKFQRECTNLLYTYQERSEELHNPVAQQPHFPAQQQFQAYPIPSSGTLSSSGKCQPPHHQWPATVQQNMSAWGPQNPVLGRGHMTELRPVQMPTMVHNQSGEPAFNLSSLVNSSIEMCETPLDRAVAALDD